MSFALLFWILMLFWLVFGLWAQWPATGNPVRPVGPTVLLFILLVLLGWGVFKAPLHP